MMYTVSEMAKMLGVSASTLRYYEREGLLPFVERTNGGIRLFTEQDIPWLKCILFLKQAGMSLKELHRYVDLAIQGDRALEQKHRWLEEQSVNLQKQIQAQQQALDLVNYYKWYTKKALTDGHAFNMRRLTEKEIPDEFHEILRKLLEIPKNQKMEEIE